MFSIKLKPIFTNKKNLLRLGPKRDGGYIVDKRIFNKIEYIVTCGLSDDWNFEKHFLKYNDKVLVLAYDHTVNLNFWIKRFFKDIFHLILFKKLSLWKISNIFKASGYKSYYKDHPNKNARLNVKFDEMSKINPNKPFELMENDFDYLVGCGSTPLSYKGSRSISIIRLIKSYKNMLCK